MPWGQKSHAALSAAACQPPTDFQRGNASVMEIEGYAQRLLEQESGDDVHPDTSLGSYITSALKEADAQTPVGELAEFDSLRELIQEHCFLDSAKVDDIIHQIAAAVRSKQVPDLESNSLIPKDLWEENKPSNDDVDISSRKSNEVYTSMVANAQLASSSNVQNGNDQYTSDTYQLEQAFESSVEILLSMNPELCEQAARAALNMVQGDVNWGQYIVDVAFTAPPICRHLLGNGCYRKDCQFSHDVEGHTCLFWMRGRCTKGSTCQFRHGFDEKIVEAALPASDSDKTSTLYREDDDDFVPLSQPSTARLPVGNVWGRTPSGTSFAEIASQGLPSSSVFPSLSSSTEKAPAKNIRRVDIPQDLWHAHENRDSSVFYISDPLERYRAVSSTVLRKDVIDLHFQSLKTFGQVLEIVLPNKLREHVAGVWVVTGTGHHVGSRTHQKGGGTLEAAVSEWLTANGYKFSRGRDKNGLGGALLVTG